ncbi:MAG: hypothetical protein B7Y45_06440 [Sphingomonas sp. 28-66-16]|nr:MAG: hypothetical protein B7Y45_06440 [Sphingomonas sp. 28-66-16]
MRLSRNSVALGALALGLVALGLPALGQEKPESILPPGFGEPVPPAPAPSEAPPSPPASRPASPAPGSVAQPVTAAPAAAPAGDVTDELAAATPIDPAVLAAYELPAYARRSLAMVGVVGTREGGLAADAFGDADGRFLSTLMGRLDAPIASRWVSIGLRRALASRVSTPPHVSGADFAAERAWLLVRMGESMVSRALVESVDTDRYTPKMYEAAMQAALATGDPAVVCPVVDAAQTVSTDRAWVLAGAICAGLAGKPGVAGPLIDGAKRRGVARGVDILLAEKAVGAGARGGRAVTIEWDGVDQLTSWRYGMAMATGVTIPDPLYATVGRRVQYWRAQSPMIDARTRAPSAELAAAQGVFSNAALVDLYGEVENADEQSSAEAGVARDLRSAYVESDRTQRLTVLRQLWDEPKDRRGRYARLVLTARAASTIAPASDTPDVDRLVAAMLSAGLDRSALRWKGDVARGSDAWAMLTLADGGAVEPLGQGDVDAYRSRTADPSGAKVRMFFAALAGLGRIDRATSASLSGRYAVDLAMRNSWTRAIDRAAANRQPGTVLLLAAVGMQTPNWTGVSPAALYHIVAALQRVGLDGEARMIAVEALTRL